MSNKLLEITTSPQHLFHPYAPATQSEVSLEQKILGAVFFIFASIATGGGMAAFYLYFASKKVSTVSKLSKAKEQLNILATQVHEDKTKKQIEKVQEFFNRKFFNAEKKGELHYLHDQITDITFSVRGNEELKKIWSVFLDNIHGAKISLFNCKLVSLNFAPEMDYLNTPGSQPAKEVMVEKLDRGSPTLKQDLKQIYRIFNESFKGPFIKPFLQMMLFQPKRKVVVARDISSKEIVGITFVDLENKQKWIHISYVARKANAAKRGIGTAIFQYLDKEYFPKYQARLEVLKDNVAAVGLYEKFGFKPAIGKPQSNVMLMARNKS